VDGKKKLIIGAVAAVMTLGGGSAALAAQQGAEENIKGGTITAPQGSGENAKGLEGLAKIDRAAAEEAALAAVPGEVREVELESESSFVVYEVEVAGKDGKLHEAVVDAGNGKVLAQETEGGED
jgi:uncharacterized membrane protein YkoI